jgi:hypothetical protein
MKKDTQPTIVIFLNLRGHGIFCMRDEGTGGWRKLYKEELK